MGHSVGSTDEVEPDRGPKLPTYEGPSYEGHDTSFEGFLAAGIVGSEGNEGNGSQPRVRLQFREDRQAVFPAEVEIKQDEPDVVVLRYFERTFKAACQEDLDTQWVEAPGDELGDTRFVVDDQDCAHALVCPSIDSTLRVRAMGEKGFVK